MNRIYIRNMTVFTAICSILTIGCHSNSVEAGNENTAIPVEVVEISRMDTVRELTYIGTIEESKSVPHSFAVMGNVQKVLVNDGDHVKKGQLLAVLNNESYTNTYEMALATERQAKDAYKRLEALYRNGNLPEIRFVEVQTGLQKAQAAAAIARKNMADCNLHAIESGVVGRRSIEPGMNTLPGVTSITIVKIDTVFARIAVPENEVGGIKKGEKVQIEIPALNGAKYTGTVKEIGIVADMLSHTYKIKIIIYNNNGRLRPGMLCNAVMRRKVKQKAVLVPSESVIIDEDGRPFVYKADLKNGKALKRYVKTGDLTEDGMAVFDGVRLHDHVIIAGQHKLSDQSSVSIINKE